MSTRSDLLVEQQAEADLEYRRANARDVLARVDHEKAWALHRALTLNVQVRPEPGEAWKGNAGGTVATWSEEQQQALLNKYHEHLLRM